MLVKYSLTFEPLIYDWQRKIIKTLLLISFAILFTACATKPPADKPALKLVNYVDPEKFEGEWYIIANIPYFAEKNKVAGKSIYQKRTPSKSSSISSKSQFIYDDIYVYRKKDFNHPEKRLKGKIRSVSDNHNRWKSTFFGLINFTFEVIYVAPDYSMMLYGHPSRQYGWVMSATPELKQAQYNQAMSIFERNNYNIDDFLKVPQLESQVGEKGNQ